MREWWRHRGFLFGLPQPREECQEGGGAARVEADTSSPCAAHDGPRGAACYQHGDTEAASPSGGQAHRSSVTRGVDRLGRLAKETWRNVVDRKLSIE